MTFLTNLKAKMVGTVDDIVSEFHNVANKLDVRAKLHAAEADAHANASRLSAKLANIANTEKERAEAISAKIKALVSSN